MPSASNGSAPSSSKNGNSNQNRKAETKERPVEHPLEHTWRLTYFMAGDNVAYELRQVEVCTFDTIEEFWRLYNHVEPPSNLENGKEYALFRVNIQPLIDNHQNKYGGRWILKSEVDCRKPVLEKIWEELMMMMTGCAQGAAVTAEINGGKVILREDGDTVELWTAHSDDGDLINQVGQSMLGALQHVPNLQNQTIEFYNNEDTRNGMHVVRYKL